MPRLSAKTATKEHTLIYMDSPVLQAALAAWLANTDRWWAALDVGIVQLANTHFLQG